MYQNMCYLFIELRQPINFLELEKEKSTLCIQSGKLEVIIT